MKKLKLFISLWFTMFSMVVFGQAEYEKIAITQNTQDNNAGRILVQDAATGEIKYIAKSILDLKKSKKIITILAVGQSNMCGHYTGGGDYGTNANVKVWNGSAFVVADLNSNPFIEQDLYNTHPNNNIAFHFAKQLQEDTDNEIRIITSMHTGQPIEYWNIGGSAWTELTTKITASSTTKIDIILFMQGEGNTSDSIATYSTKFNTFLTNIRNLTSVNDNVPFICGELKQGTSYATQNGFFDNLKSYVTDNFVVTAKTKELPVDGGVNDPFSVHYSGASLVKMGRERFYNAFLNSNKNATDNTLERLVINNPNPESGFNVINGSLSVGSHETKIYTGSYLSSSTEAFVQARDLNFNKTLRLISGELIIEDDFPSSIYTKVGINVKPLTTFHSAVGISKTSLVPTVSSLLSTNEANNPFALRVMIYGAANLANRYVTLQTGDYGVSDGGNLVLQQSTGNVAIGNLTASEKLDVNGNIKATSFIKSGGTSSQFLKADGSVSTLTNPITGTGITNYIPRFTGGSTLGNSLIFDNGTSLGINTNSPESGWKFDVAGITTMGGTAGNGRLYISSDGTTNGITYIQARNLSVATPISYLASSHTFNTNVTAPGFFQSSDLRLKDIISRDGDVIKYKWKDKRDDKIHIGYVAQEVQKENPDQVNADEKGYLSVNYVEILVEKMLKLEHKVEVLTLKLKEYGLE